MVRLYGIVRFACLDYKLCLTFAWYRSYGRLPLYAEAKLMFFIYLWCPKTKVCRARANLMFWFLHVWTYLTDMSYYCREPPMSMRPSLGHTSHNMRMTLIAIFSSFEQELAICLSFTGRSLQLLDTIHFLTFWSMLLLYSHHPSYQGHPLHRLVIKISEITICFLEVGQC